MTSYPLKQAVLTKFQQLVVPSLNQFTSKTLDKMS